MKKNIIKAFKIAFVSIMIASCGSSGGKGEVKLSSEESAALASLLKGVYLSLASKPLSDVVNRTEPCDAGSYALKGSLSSSLEMTFNKCSIKNKAGDVVLTVDSGLVYMSTSAFSSSLEGFVGALSNEVELSDVEKSGTCEVLITHKPAGNSTQKSPNVFSGTLCGATI